MALFTDGTISSISDLTDQDSSLLDLSDTEALNLTTKLTLAREEVGIELISLLERSRSGRLGGQPVSNLNQIAVTPTLRLWHTFQTLSLVYRDAYYSQLNDRYRGKWVEFMSQARWARTKLLEMGVGIVLNPVSRADAPILRMIPATGTGGNYYVSVTLLNAQGEEGAPSTVVTADIADGHVLSIEPGGTAANVLNWNAYVGIDPADVQLQNTLPLALGSAWVYSATTAQSGRNPGSGQAPNFFRPLPRLLQRG